MAKLGKSHLQGLATEPLIGDTIGAHFDSVVARWPENDALIVRHQGVRWSFRRFRQEVDAFAAGLLALGLEPGDRVGIWSPNNAEWLVSQYATAKAGLILVTINPAYRVAEVEYALNKVGCAALITAPAFKSSDYLGMLRALAPELDRARPGELKAERIPTLRWVIRLGRDATAGTLNFDDVAPRAGAAERRRLEELASTLQFDDPINIQFSSGTTGAPKAATLTHHNILNNGHLTGEAMRFTDRDRLCIPVPMYHCFGMVLGSLACATHGAAMVYPSEAFDARAALETVHAERCTAIHGVPTMFIAMLDHPDFRSFDLSSLRTGIMAGAPCPIELMKRVTRDMHLPELTIAYGMTETSPVSFQTSVDDSLERRVSTVGRVLPHTEVKVVDSDGRIVAPGVSGELLTRGYCVMLGYWGDPERTAASIDRARWMHSGDLATIDDGGYCKIVGRIKDMVIRGGENIFPREIEEFLFRHPKIENVQVFGVPDPKYGEELCAWVKLRDGSSATEEDIRAFCRDQIAHYKIPRYVRFVDSFPMTITGKIQKFIMRERMMEELGLREEKTA